MTLSSIQSPSLKRYELITSIRTGHQSKFHYTLLNCNTCHYITKEFQRFNCFQTVHAIRTSDRKAPPPMLFHMEVRVVDIQFLASSFPFTVIGTANVNLAYASLNIVILLVASASSNCLCENVVVDVSLRCIAFKRCRCFVQLDFPFD